MNATFRGSNGKKEFISNGINSFCALCEGYLLFFLDSTIQKVYNHFVTRHEAALSLRRSEGLHIFLKHLHRNGRRALRHEAFPDFSPHAAELSGKFSFGRI